MAVVNVTEHPRDEAEANRDGRSYRRSYTVLFDDPANADAIQARQASGIPRVGDPYPGDFFMRVRRVTPRTRGNSRVLYDVEVEYGTPSSSSGSGSSPGDNPLDQPAQVRWSFARQQEGVDEDINGEPLVTTAGEGFDPPVTIQTSDPVLVITKNQPTFDIAQAIEYKDAVNSDPFLGVGPGQAKIEGIDAESVVEGDFEFWRVTVEIHFRRGERASATERAWWLRIFNQGTRAINANGDIDDAIILDTNGDPVTDEQGQVQRVRSPWPLKADGTQFAHDEGAHWLEFEVYPSKPFSVLNII